MLIDDKKQMAMGLLLEGKYIKTEIALKCDRSRQWLYDQVINNEICKGEMDKELTTIQICGVATFKSNLEKCIQNIIALANNSESDKINLDANDYLVNRVLGNTTTKLDIANVTEQKEVTASQLENEFSKFKELKEIVDVEGTE